jgi:hypothetical protein
MWLGEIICHGWLSRVVVGAIGSSGCMGQVIPLDPMMKRSEKPFASRCYALESSGAFIASTFVVLNLSGVNLWCHQRVLVHNQPQLSHTWFCMFSFNALLLVTSEGSGACNQPALSSVLHVLDFMQVF